MIGWFQIIGFVQIIQPVLALTNPNLEDKTPDLTYALNIIKIVCLVVSFAMGIVLLVGLYRKNPGQLKSWIIFESL
ncbi:unnamed protein product, partial [Allacma fusca]